MISLEGNLSLITKHGRPVFLAVPFTQDILDLGLRTALAIKLYKERTLSLEKAAKLSNNSLEAFIEKLGNLGIPIADYSAEEIEKELKDFD